MDGITVYPEEYQDYLLQNVPQLYYLDGDARRRMIRAVTSSVLTTRYSHKKYDGTFYPSSVLKKHFGNEYRTLFRIFFDVLKVKKGDRYVEVYQYGSDDPEDNYTKCYRLKSHIEDTVQNYFTKRHFDRGQLLVNGKRCRLKSNGIYATDLNGRVRKSRVKISPLVPIDVDRLYCVQRSLSKVYDDLFEGSEPRKTEISGLYEEIHKRAVEKERTSDFTVQEHELKITQSWHATAGALLDLANQKPAPEGYLIQFYQETSTGRLQGVGVHLQSVSKMIRNEILKGQGLWQYDFSNCHYSILDQMAQWQNIELETVRFYNTHKSEFRRTIADEVGASISSVKMGLISIIYGASKRDGYTLSDIFGDDTKDFLQHPHIEGLFQDIRKATGPIIESSKSYQNEHGKFIKNVMGKSISADEDRKSILAHLLQGAEAYMMNAIIETHPAAVKLLLFDGFISDRELNVNELENLVQNNTGFSVKIDEEKL